MEKKEEPHKYSKPLVRIKAFIIDILIILIPGLLINSLLLQIKSPQAILYTYAALFNIASFLYFVYFTYKKNGSTLGKKVMKMKVVSLHGKLHLQQVIIRYAVFFTLLSVFPYIAGLFARQIGDIVGFVATGVLLVMVFFDSRRQSLHDKAAKTIVIEVPPHS